MNTLRFIVLSCAPIAFVSVAAAQGNPLPNIIFFMADDMGMGDTSAYQDITGNADEVQVHTPAMEKLARMGVRFTDAHTPASRCTGTRYGLLTGRYPWRNRLKYWVLFGSQGDPMIERDRPTIASILQDAGYQTGMVGKWHVGLRYRRADGSPADAWLDADLTQPLHDSPLDHGFHFCRFTSRSHGTSGPSTGGKKRNNAADQNVGPGHIHGRTIVAASGDGKRLNDEGEDAYVLSKLGGRHSDHAIDFLSTHVRETPTRQRPFFLYYPSNSNHAPYTPDQAIGGKPVAGASRTKSGAAMSARYDFVYENDVALDRLMDYLAKTVDPRRPGKMLIENTMIVFTSDNGAEVNDNVCTGPIRSNKGSVYEGGHRVPFLVAWPLGNVGDGDDATPGKSNASVIGHQDMFATFAEIIGRPQVDFTSGGKGGEDSTSVLKAMQGEEIGCHPIFFCDHKEAKKDPAVIAFRRDIDASDSLPLGKWKVFFRPEASRFGVLRPYELYDLQSDPQEQRNRIEDSDLASLLKSLTAEAERHRNAGGHGLAEIASDKRVQFRWGGTDDERSENSSALAIGKPAKAGATFREGSLQLTLSAVGKVVADTAAFDVNARGLGVDSGTYNQVDDGESLLVRFNQDVIIESVSIAAGNGQCGGFYTVGEGKPLAIYCVDADIDARDQSGAITDIGVLRSGDALRLSSAPHYGTESPGKWRLQAIHVRLLNSDAN